MVFLPIVKTRYRLKTSPGRDGRKRPLRFLDRKTRWWSHLTLLGFLVPKIRWCGWDYLPPGFLFPVKEQVACMKRPKEDGCINRPFFV